MRIRILGGFAALHDDAPVEIAGATQRALLFRLALDPGTTVTYRALAEDLWDDPPENPRASLQSLVSRLRAVLPGGVVESAAGGYRLAVDRADVDAVRLQDLVAEARRSSGADAIELARRALELTGPPWTPGPGYDWLERAVRDDRAEAEAILAGDAGAGVPAVGRRSVPAPLTALVGREDELRSVAVQLASSRLVTLLGPGGAGKTRLALEVAGEHPAVLVELAPAGSDEVMQAVLGSLGRDVRASGELTASAVRAEDLVIAQLAGRDLLLVLDNCEHVVDAAADAAALLLGALPRLRILATSREPLGVPGEALTAVGPLSDAAAERLFAERVLQARGTSPVDDEAADAERIRSCLDGMPLALELAAAKARTLSLAEIADGLDDRFTLLTGGPRTTLPRHRTLRAVVDWSWQLLGEHERRALTAVAVYPGGVSVADVAEISRAHGIDPGDLDALVDRSLLRRDAGRYRALDTIRAFGLETLASDGPDALRSAQRAQASWLVTACERQDVRLRTRDGMAALAWFDAEDDNVFAVLRGLQERREGPILVRLVGACVWYFILRDRNADGMTWLRAAAPYSTADDSDAGVLVRLFATFLSGSETSHPDSDEERLAYFDEALAAIGIRDDEELDALADRHSDLLQVFPTIGRIAFGVMTGRPVAIVEPPEDPAMTPWAQATLRTLLALFAHNQGDVEVLGRLSADGLARFEEIGDVWGLAVARQIRSEWLVLEGRLQEALDLADAASADMRRVTSEWDLTAQRGITVRLMFGLGRIDEARERAAELIAEARADGSPGAIAQAAVTGAMLRVALGEHDPARELVAEADAAFAELPQRAGQLSAMIETARALTVDTRRAGESESAWTHLRAAADLAIASRDQPIMATVAVAIGTVAEAEGDRPTARRALSAARALRGAADPTDPLEMALARALGDRGQAAAPALDRAEATEELAQILRR